jgi:aldehyde:ferredoxin oxidoreductase
VEISRKMQVGRSAYDVLGLCAFLTAATAMLNALYGLELEPSYVGEAGLDTIRREIEFSRAAGFMPLPPFNLVWDVDDEKFDSIFA